MPHPPPFDRAQMRSFHLAGTVAIPTPFPEVGTLRLRPSALAYQGGDEMFADDLVDIEHVQSHRLVIVRTVRLSDVAAVLLGECVNPIDLSAARWYFGPEVGEVLEARANDNTPGLMMGIAYVRESAPVLMRVEVGMTAAESVEYYPPVLGERSDDHYRLSGAGRKAKDCDPCGGCGSIPGARRFVPRDPCGGCGFAP
jgi:hypothetical protein